MNTSVTMYFKHAANIWDKVVKDTNINLSYTIMTSALNVSNCKDIKKWEKKLTKRNKLFDWKNV